MVKKNLKKYWNECISLNQEKIDAKEIICTNSNFINLIIKPKILLVEDNKLINDSTKTILLRIITELNLDNEIVQLNDGVDIIKQVMDDQFNGWLIKCVITDENIEYMNGSEAVKILKKDRKLRILRW